MVSNEKRMHEHTIAKIYLTVRQCGSVTPTDIYSRLSQSHLLSILIAHYIRLNNSYILYYNYVQTINKSLSHYELNLLLLFFSIIKIIILIYNIDSYPKISI